MPSIALGRPSVNIESAGQLTNFLNSHKLRIEALVTLNGQPAPGSAWRAIVVNDDSKMEPVVLFTKGTITHGRVRLAELLTWSSALAAASDTALRRVATIFDKAAETTRFDMVANRPVLLPFGDLELVMRPNRDARNYQVKVKAVAHAPGGIGSTLSLDVSVVAAGRGCAFTRSIFVPATAGAEVLLDSCSSVINTQYVTRRGEVRTGDVVLTIETYRPQLAKLA